MREERAVRAVTLLRSVIVCGVCGCEAGAASLPWCEHLDSLVTDGGCPRARPDAGPAGNGRHRSRAEEGKEAMSDRLVDDGKALLDFFKGHDWSPRRAAETMAFALFALARTDLPSPATGGPMLSPDECRLLGVQLARVLAELARKAGILP